MAPVAPTLAAFATGPAPDDAALRAVAARHVSDVLGCGLAATGTGAGGEATEVVRADGGRAAASVLGVAERLPAAATALANGTRCHALDFDDTHEAGICHVSAVVVPAALAVAEEQGAPGRDLLDAWLLGSEVALRIAAALAPGLYARGFHPTSVCGAFGAAAAAARLQGLGTDRAAHALGVVGSFASGLLEYLSDGAATKPLHAGWAAQAGVRAAALAAAGATGPATVIEGRFGLRPSHTGTDVAVAVDGLGERWEAARVAIKPYPACHFLHAVTWAAGRLADEHGLGPDDVLEVDARVPAEGLPLVLDPIAAKRRPQTPYDAKFSAPFTIAHRLVHGDLTVRSFAPDAVAEPDVLALAGRVGGGAWPGEPPSRFAGAVTVRTPSGTHELEVPHTPGSPGNPMSDDWVAAKLRANAALALDDPGALVALLGDLDAQRDLGAVTAELRAAR